VHLVLEDDHHKDAAKSNDFVQDAVKSPDVLLCTAGLTRLPMQPEVCKNKAVP